MERLHKSSDSNILALTEEYLTSKVIPLTLLDFFFFFGEGITRPEDDVSMATVISQENYSR